MKAIKISLLILVTSLMISLPASARAADEAATAKIPEVKVSGFIQALYAGRENAIDQFKVNRARVKVSGDLDEDISYEIMIDATQASILYEGAINLSYIPEAKLRIGQFKTPFSYEYLTASSKLDVIYYTPVVSALATKYDIGVQVSGDWTYFGYALGVFNGEGQNKPDANNNKDLVGRIVLKPIKDLELGVSHCQGRSGVARVDKDRTGVNLAYVHDPFSLKGEYIFAQDDDLDRDGFFAQLAYKVVSKLQALAKYATYDPDKDASDDNLDEVTLGLNWFFHKNAKLQLNYICQLADDEVADNIYASQLQVSF